MRTCKRVVFPLPLRPNIKPKLHKYRVRYIKATRNIIKPEQICLPFLPKREVNFFQQVLFSSRRSIGDFSHLKEIVVQSI